MRKKPATPIVALCYVTRSARNTSTTSQVTACRSWLAVIGNNPQVALWSKVAKQCSLLIKQCSLSNWEIVSELQWTPQINYDKHSQSALFINSKELFSLLAFRLATKMVNVALCDILSISSLADLVPSWYLLISTSEWNVSFSGAPKSKNIRSLLGLPQNEVVVIEPPLYPQYEVCWTFVKRLLHPLWL